MFDLKLQTSLTAKLASVCLCTQRAVAGWEALMSEKGQGGRDIWIISVPSLNFFLEPKLAKKGGAVEKEEGGKSLVYGQFHVQLSPRSRHQEGPGPV